ncbi:hypothetical protein [Candidatus Villigracilis affinis]|uniref:hypothetical protein n=1 Tax=Candidatus Villigracilis affinis TaxID=3140682 RepID=UPI001D507CC3|nr:class I SAM-dependent methyltransferase [Anaerolineales bacterium]
MKTSPTFTLLEAANWHDYELLDSGDGLKMERFGKYIFSRPESQAMWSRALPASEWNNVHAVFQPTAEESGGHWVEKKKLPEKWEMKYPLPHVQNLTFSVMTTPGRHLGVFPEVASHWDFMADSVRTAGRPAKVLNLFGYTGLASLAAAAAGAQVTHVDASKKSVGWARENPRPIWPERKTHPLDRGGCGEICSARRKARHEIRRHHSRPAQIWTRPER